MADLSKLRLNGNEYYFKDTTARSYFQNNKIDIGRILYFAQQEAKIYVPEGIEFAASIGKYRTLPFLFIIYSGDGGVPVITTPSPE